MKETITIKIIERGKAKEVNPLGEKPDLIKIPICNNLGASFKAEQDYLFNLKNWQEAESKLKTFEIDMTRMNLFCKKVEECFNGEISHLNIGYNIGSIRQARILDNGKIEII